MYNTRTGPQFPKGFVYRLIRCNSLLLRNTCKVIAVRASDSNFLPAGFNATLLAVYLIKKAVSNWFSSWFMAAESDGWAMFNSAATLEMFLFMLIYLNPHCKQVY